MKVMTMLKRISFISSTVLLAGAIMTGCVTNDSTSKASNHSLEVRAVSHNPIAHLSDLVALTNNLPGTRRVAYFAIEMNDQTTQPFSQDLARQQFPIWTDVDIKCTYTNDNGETGHVIFSTVMGPIMGPDGIESPVAENTPYVSVEIPAVYNNTPDTRLNVRMDYTKYSSVANFLFANGREGMVFDSLDQANSRYAGIKRGDPEYGKWYNVFKYAPKSILVKIDLDQAETEMFHNENNKIYFSYNRRVGSMHREKAAVADQDDQVVWTPIFPRWVRTSFFNEFAKGDVQ